MRHKSEDPVPLAKTRYEDMVILIGISTSRGEQNTLSFMAELQPDVLIASRGAVV